jgi:RNA polymerase sigma-70 factor (ECF subfamily)
MALEASGHKVSGTDLHRLVAQPLAEAVLIERARAGDRDAQDELVRRHLADVYALTLRILRDRDLAQDAAQDALVNALNGLSRFRGEASFRTWLLRVAANAARTVLRKRGRRKEVAIELAGDIASSEADVGTETATRAEADRIGKLVDRLPPKQRMAVTLRVQQGLSYDEIGRIMKCSEGAARVNYHLGIKRLKESLQ